MVYRHRRLPTTCPSVVDGMLLKLTGIRNDCGRVCVCERERRKRRNKERKWKGERLKKSVRQPTRVTDTMMKQSSHISCRTKTSSRPAFQSHHNGGKGCWGGNREEGEIHRSSQARAPGTARVLMKVQSRLDLSSISITRCVPQGPHHNLQLPKSERV